MALNSVRGAAFHAIVRFALWVRRHVSSEADAQAKAEAEELIHKGLQVLDHHLRPEVDSSLAVRSVFGELLPWLVLLDHGWVAAHVGDIFPADPTEWKLRNAAWNTYLAFNQPYQEVFQLLTNEHRRAVDELGISSGEVGDTGDQYPAPTPGWRLGEHLMISYLRGAVALDSEDRLIEDFFAHAAEVLRAHALEYVGLVLQHTPGEVSPDVLARAQRLWDARVQVAAAAPEAHLRELAAFGDWYGSGKLESVWGLLLQL